MLPCLDVYEHEIAYWTSPLLSAVAYPVFLGQAEHIRSAISQLINFGAKITEAVLAASIESSGIDALQYLVRGGGVTPDIGGLALARAACLGNFAAVDFLLSWRVDINSKIHHPMQPSNGQTDLLSPLQFAISPLSYEVCGCGVSGPGSLDMIEHLIKKSAEIDTHIMHSTLRYRPRPGYDPLGLLSLLQRYGALGLTKENAFTLLRDSVFCSLENELPERCERVLQFLLDIKAPIFCIAALTLIIRGGVHRRFINLILDNIASVNANPPPDPDPFNIELDMDRDPSRFLSTSHSLFLIPNRLDADSFVEGYSPLRAAVVKRDIELAAELLRRGAGVNYPALRLSGLTPRKSLTIIRLTTLQMACMESWRLLNEPEDLFSHLLSPEADASDFLQYYPSLSARVSLELVQLLLENGADVNAVSDISALHLAAETGDLRVCMLLVGAGADVNICSKFLQGEPLRPHSGEPDAVCPLEIAVFFGRLDIVQFLLDCGATSFDQRLTPYDGAMELAQWTGRHGLVRILMQRCNNLTSFAAWQEERDRISEQSPARRRHRQRQHRSLGRTHLSSRVIS